MDEKNCELLFEYLRSILFDPQVKPLDVEALDEPFQKLGRGLQFLDHAVQEMKAYSGALASGNLSDYTPARDNFLCENLKNIHANLNHLTWQAKQVAKGDYSQKVSYLGEFSNAFNTMTEQLKGRELSLKNEASQEKANADLMESYNNLLLDLIRRSQEDVLITHATRHEVLFSSSSTISEKQSQELYQLFLDRQKNNDLELDPVSGEWNWLAEDSEHHFFRIITTTTHWQGEPAFAHIILDITAEKLEQERLEQEVFLDSLTRIGNRHYFQKQAFDLLQTNDEMIFCYCDLDNLKTVNDTFGHAEGDRYLHIFVRSVKQHIRKNDVFARIGGDEFCLILKDCSLESAYEKLIQIQTTFASLPPKTYEKSFCFGIVHLTDGHGPISLDEIIGQADEAMYQQKKRLHKDRRI